MILVCSLAIVGTVSILANILIIHVVRVNAQMHTSTNFLIVSMACGDLLATILTIPFGSYTLVMFQVGRNWVTDLDPPARSIVCRMKRYLFFASLFCSIYSLVGITFGRFLAVVRPLTHPQGKRWNKTLIPLVWLVSLTLPFHQLVSAELVLERNGLYVCEAVGSKTDAYLFVVLGYALPHVLMIALYVAIAIALYKRRVPGERHTSNAQAYSAAKQTANKVTRMIICILLAFNLCYAPLFVLYVSPFLEQHYQLSDIRSRMSSKVLMIFNGTSNALIYAIFNEKFRRAFKAALYNESLASAFRIVRNRSRSSTLTTSVNNEKHPVKVVAIETVKA